MLSRPLVFLWLLLLSAPVLAQRITLSGIHVSGNRTTREEIILRELNIKAGAAFPADSAAALLEQNLLRLKNLALFTEVQLRWDTLTALQWELWITVKERWYIWPEVHFKLADRNFNVWWQEYGHDWKRIEGSLALTHQNFRGNLEQLAAGVRFGYTQGFQLSYQLPYLNRDQTRGLGFGYNFSRNHEAAFTTDSNKLRMAQSRDEFLVSSHSISVNYNYRPAYHTTHQVYLTYRTLQIADTLLHLNENYFPSGQSGFKFLNISYRLALNYTDNWSYPTLGKKLVNYTGWTQGLKGNAQVYLNTEAGLFLQPLPRILSSHIFRGRLSFPQKQSFYLNQAMGYDAGYVRGFEHFVTEGPHYAIGRSSIKFELFKKTFQKLPLRYLPNIPVAVYPKLFADMGYSYQPLPGNYSFLNNKLLYSAGAGVDVVTAYDVKLRLEYARNSLGQWGWYLHLGGE